MSWNEEQVAELSRLWESGSSAAAIGRELGVSKNAVVGKAHRLKLAARPSPIRIEHRRPVRRPIPVLTELPAPRVAAPAPPPRRAAPRTDATGSHCLWPFGDPRRPGFHFCAAPAVADKPYCPEHCARAYITRARRDDQAA